MRRWIDDPVNATDDERLRGVVERLRAYRALVEQLMNRIDRD
jgi:hypothetical protein